MTNTDEQDVAVNAAVADTTATPGANLQAARESKGLSVEEVASVLRISRAKLAALEADHYEEMPAEAYVRGYIRAYCKLVDLDEATQLASYEEFRSAHQQVEQLIQVEDARAPVSILPLVKRVWYVPVLVLAVVLGMMLLQSPKVTVPAVPVTPVEAPVLAPDVEESEPVPEVSEAEDVDAGPAPERVAEPVPAMSSRPVEYDQLVLVFSEECWLEVSDAKGDVLAADLKQAGDRVELVGKAPFNVMLGNARAAQVTINDRAVSADPQGNNRALRLQVE